MMFFATPSSPAIKAAMTAGHLGAMLAPGGGSPPPAGAAYACDNAKFGKCWPGVEAWLTWLGKTVARAGRDRCAFATAPDVVGDPVATLAESLPQLGAIRALGVPAAFVGQDGCEAGDLIPWGHFDVLFLGGSTDWKLGPGARQITTEARHRGLAVHMGRVNSERRLRYADAIGCTSADGTILAFGPDIHLPRLRAWLRGTNDQTTLWGPA